MVERSPSNPLESSQKITLLSKIKIFQPLAEDDLADLAKITTEKSLPVGSFLFHQGDDPDVMYVIVEGQLTAFMEERGQRIPLGNFGPGEDVGQMAMLADLPRSATAFVSSPEGAKLLVLSKDDFEGFLAQNLGVMRQFVNLMSSRLQETSNLVGNKLEGWSQEVEKNTLLEDAIKRSNLEIEEVRDSEGKLTSYNIVPKTS